MKFILLGTAAALAIGSASQAEVTFTKGVGSFSLGSFAEVDDYMIFDTEFDTAFSAGNFGFQIGAGLQNITDFSDSISLSNFELHGYKNTGNDNKFGVYVASGFGYYFGGGNVIGAEAMIGLGAIDLEASVGYVSISGSDLIMASLDVYVDVSSNIELSAGFDGIFIDSDSYSSANVGASYAFGSSGYSVNAEYSFGIDDYVSDHYKVGISWEFGPNSDERLFGDRYLDFVSLGGI